MIEAFPVMAAAIFALGTAAGALGLRGVDAMRRRRATGALAVRCLAARGAVSNPASDLATPPVLSLDVADCFSDHGLRGPVAAPPPGPQELLGRTNLCVRPSDIAAAEGRRATPLSVIAGGALMRLRAEDHAAALINWCVQPRPEGLAGETVTAVDMIEIYAEMCAERGWEQRPWQPVAVAFMRLAGISKRYEWRGKNRVRVYEIPRTAPVPITGKTGVDDETGNEMRAAA